MPADVKPRVHAARGMVWLPCRGVFVSPDAIDLVGPGETYSTDPTWCYVGVGTSCIREAATADEVLVVMEEARRQRVW